MGVKNVKIVLLLDIGNRMSCAGFFLTKKKCL